FLLDLLDGSDAMIGIDDFLTDFKAHHTPPNTVCEKFSLREQWPGFVGLPSCSWGRRTRQRHYLKRHKSVTAALSKRQEKRGTRKDER
ncbi:MAG TPA: hypothetical protein VF634_03445, partial [Pyrinomonadaceae bacterium]